ncbi:hypothetical protein OPV22_008872 [Ensete ventricosum]|uniref:Neprosin domain-containing protein n=1 Tax=Ensete ventricosum TaxID=4639 RepID=A0AAV8PXV1_ENSVE|nr:hypothetical protein OPV22_008872 [Ensete ventricosum]
MPLSSFVMMIIAESPKSRFYIYWGIMPERHEWEGCNDGYRQPGFELITNAAHIQ